MELQQLRVTVRDASGKGAASRVRASKNVPGVVYGGNAQPLSVAIDEHEMMQLLHSRGGQHAVVQLQIEDKPDLSSPALLKAVQYHPVKGDVLHVDFLRFRLDERISTSVQLNLTGRPACLQEGGMLDQQLRELEIECLALDVPEEIAFDVSWMNIGDTVHVEALKVPDNITVLTDPERAVATVVLPRMALELEAEEAAEAEEGAEGVEGEEGQEETKGQEEQASE